MNRINYFDHKVIIITGSSSGIGKALVDILSQTKAKLVLASRNEALNAELVQKIQEQGKEAVSIYTDVSKEQDCKHLVDRVIHTYGKIDILINNAGISMRAKFEDLQVDVLQKVMDVNFWGAVYCTKYALPYILKQEGSVVGISSICGTTPLPGRTGYAASKHALDGFLESLRIENYKKNIHVMLVHPGFTASNIRQTALNKDGEAQEETPLNESKLMSAERVAKKTLLGIVQRKKDVTLSINGKLITTLHKLAPALSEKILYYHMRKEEGAPF